jgi:hypothetical protein
MRKSVTEMVMNATTMVMSRLLVFMVWSVGVPETFPSDRGYIARSLVFLPLNATG